MNYKKISEFFVLFSIALLFIKKSLLGFNISDLSLLLGLVAIVVSLLRKEVEFKLIKNELLVAICIVDCFIVGTGLSFLLGYQIPIGSVIWEYTRYFSSLLFALVVIIHLKTNKNFLLGLGEALLVSLVLIPLSYLIKIPGVNALLYDSSVYRFAGLSNDPNYFTYFFLLPTLIIFHNFVEKVFEKRYFPALIFAATFSSCTGLIVWSGSRGGILGLLLSLAVYLIIYTYNNFSLKNIKFLAVSFLLVPVSLLSCFLLLPSEAKTDTFKRFPILNHYFEKNNDVNIKSGTKQEKVSISDALVKGQNREEVWKQALAEIKKNPFGYGPAYNTIINLSEIDTNKHSDSFNIILQILLTGGVQLLVVFGCTLLMVLRKAENAFLGNNQLLLVISCFFGVLVMSFFLDSLQTKVLWLLVSVLYWLLFQKVSLRENDSR